MADIRLLIITGNPAAGKTELAKTLGARLSGNWTVVHGDDYIEEVFRRYPGHPWTEIRPYLASVSAEGIDQATRDGKRVVYDGVVLNLDEVRTLAEGAGLTYPDPRVALLNMSCSEDTVVSRRMWVDWDRFAVPKSEYERVVKEAVIRNHHRAHTPTGLTGAHHVVSDRMSEDEVFREVLRWLLSLSRTDEPTGS